MKARWVAVALGALALSCLPQERSANWDEFKDFTKSPNEHIINVIEKPFVVRSVKGVIADTASYPLPGVLFEVQGPGGDKKIRRTKTDQHGRFKIGHLPPGRYKFKTTLVSFQSVEGYIDVSDHAPKGAEIKLTVHVGV